MPSPARFNEPFLRAVQLEPGFDKTVYPFVIPAIRSIESLSLNQPVTFLIDENGSGKSTIIEALALSAGFNAEGGTKNYSFVTHNTSSHLTENLRLIRSARREKSGFFLRAESFYNVATEAERAGLQYGGKSLHEQSHGESFLAVINHRFEPNGLYILDEPEAALSPRRQLALLLRIGQLVQQGSQCIIATHSPILLAFPNAAIYGLGSHGLSKVSYDAADHYRFMLDFLQHYPAYMERLFDS